MSRVDFSLPSPGLQPEPGTLSGGISLAAGGVTVGHGRREVHRHSGRTAHRLACALLGASLAMVVALAVAVAVDAAGASRALAAGTGREPLHGHQGIVPPGATLIGPAPSTTTLPLVVTLQPRDPAALSAEVQAVSDPRSPQYRHFLTPAEFARRFGATPSSVAQVASSAQEPGAERGDTLRDGVVAAGVGDRGTGAVRLLDTDLALPAVLGQDGVRQPLRPGGAGSRGAADRGDPRPGHPQPAAAVHDRAAGELGQPPPRHVRRGADGLGAAHADVLGPQRSPDELPGGARCGPAGAGVLVRPALRRESLRGRGHGRPARDGRGRLQLE